METFKKYSRTYVTVDLDAVAYNFESMHRNIEKSTRMIAVIKADGYGHGAEQIARLVEDYPYIWGFATATAEEAIALRNAGISKPILILGYVFEEYYEDLIRLQIRPAVFCLDMAEKLSEKAEELGKEAMIHLALDTGMTRIGFQDTKVSVDMICRIAAMKMLKIEGMFTHFARADEADKQYAKRQFDRYMDFAKQLEEAGITIPLRHCSNSAGIIDLPYANLDLVRAGISIYGIYPSQEVGFDNVLLRPVMEWKAHISHVKEVEAGVQVSYGGTFVTEKKTRIATIPVGYADGYPRLLSSKGWVLIRGRKAPILGRVCMDQFMVDVSEIEGVHAGDEVTLMGRDGETYLSVDTLGELSGRFSYEFVCDISKRVPRVYLKNNKIVEQKEHSAS